MKNNKVYSFQIIILLFFVIGITTSCTLELIVPPAPTRVVFKSVHGRYVTAMGEEDNWALRQLPELDECASFVQQYLANGKIALKTCNGRYATAPHTGNSRQMWILSQEPTLTDCGQFDLYILGDNRVALKTCADKFLTAGDGLWEPGLEWAIVGETENLDTWEVFEMIQ